MGRFVKRDVFNFLIGVPLELKTYGTLSHLLYCLQSYLKGAVNGKEQQFRVSGIQFYMPGGWGDYRDCDSLRFTDEVDLTVTGVSVLYRYFDNEQYKIIRVFAMSGNLNKERFQFGGAVLELFPGHRPTHKLDRITFLPKGGTEWPHGMLIHDELFKTAMEELVKHMNVVLSWSIDDFTNEFLADLHGEVADLLLKLVCMDIIEPHSGDKFTLPGADWEERYDILKAKLAMLGAEVPDSSLIH